MENDNPFFTNLNVAILGLGLMGGSLALALKGHCKSLSGMDIDPQTLTLARDLELTNLISSDLEAVLPSADIVILATPVKSILNLLRELPKYHPGPAVVIDLGSTKGQVTRAMEALPDRFDPIGGHPMCGKENLSLRNADPALFKDAPFVMVRLKCTSDRAVSAAEALCQVIGAHPIGLTAETQDRWTASTSHLPYLIASALVQSIPEESAPLMGPGFRSTTRLASTPSSMMLDILETNRENILDAMARFKRSFNILEDLLVQEDYARLTETLELNRSKRSALVIEKPGVSHP